MKRLFSIAFGGALILLALTASAAEKSPGRVDFGNFAPPTKGEYVEVNITSTLIGLAARLIEQEEPDFAKLLKGIESVRVNVIAVNEDNRKDLDQRAKKVRQELDSKGWERVVSVFKDAQEVGVYLKTKGEEVVQGLTVLVREEDKHAVFVNIVGDIRPEQVSLLGERLHIDAMKNLKLK